METGRYHLSKKVPLAFDEAVIKVTEELKKEGFGIITTIDLKEAFKNKIDVDFRNYIILGACNPRLAYEALLTEDKIGVYLPCNVVIQQHDNKEVEVSIVNPEELMISTGNPNLKIFATNVKDAMQKILDKL